MYLTLQFVLDCTKGYGIKSNEQKACVAGCKEEKLIDETNLKKILEVRSLTLLTFK